MGVACGLLQLQSKQSDLDFDLSFFLLLGEVSGKRRIAEMLQKNKRRKRILGYNIKFPVNIARGSVMSKHKLKQKAKQVVRTKVILLERYHNSSKHARNFANVDACKFF